MVNMRESLTTLHQTAIDLCRDGQFTTESGFTSTEDFLRQEINKTVRFIFNYLDEYRAQSPALNMATIANQQFYPYPPGLDFIHTVTWEIGGIAYDLEVIEAERTWNRLNMVDYSGSTLPQYIYPRKDDFGLYPKPTVADQTVVFNAHYTPKDMTFNDYQTGTIDVVDGGTTIVGTDTAWTKVVVGKWFNADGNWYKVSEFIDPEEIKIFRPFMGDDITNGEYKIVDSPDLPVILHELIPYRTAAAWYTGFRRDLAKAQPLLNYFWTGDFTNPNRELRNIEGGLIGYVKRSRKRGREKSQLVKRGKTLKYQFQEAWATELTEL